jgi:hypothetical protein
MMNTIGHVDEQALKRVHRSTRHVAVKKWRDPNSPNEQITPISINKQDTFQIWKQVSENILFCVGLFLL